MWLKHSSEPWPKVLEMWAETALRRRREIRHNCDKGVAEIFSEWPRYKDAIGYTLVCYCSCSVTTFGDIFSRDLFCSLYVIFENRRFLLYFLNYAHIYRSVIWLV